MSDAAGRVDDGRIVEFRSPPATEVVAALSFDDLPLATVTALGDLWTSRFRENFPALEPQPLYGVPIESFGESSAPKEFGQPFDLQFMTGPESPRLWFTSADGDSVVQIQKNWFACNWRRVKPDSTYAQWSTRRQAFVETWAQVGSWLQERGAAASVRQCEVTYINHILPREDLWTSHKQMANILRGGTEGSALFADSEQFGFTLRRQIPGDNGAAIGRLHISLQPAVRTADDAQIVVLELTARLAPGDDFMSTLDIGRRAVVEAFVQLTSEQAHEAWGLS